MLLLVLFLIFFFNYCFGRLLSIAEETLAEFLSKATGTAVDWVQMPGMKVFIYFSLKRKFFLGNHFLVYSSNNDIAYFFTPEPELTKQFFNSLVSLVRIRLGSLPFPKVAMEWQHELAVL